ncbi:virulence factor family protein [Rhizobiales bacterium RZME27]|uniref:Virulence factor family protein n=1 Tax=Endobacterium cereale TaxID=2663029 RepID=A0A6A8AFX3_9HYPH|nr:AcvB/VirJ family lysyl-phosphatidylglycerol hydrolase [Endobacterium cereale]MEB2848269.1 AcvB/VirJ family lysyl-phosphatidylglycerol hydrolase [Endobacterium cereale]MQY48126.1 virulence factor family protein [Endobacterium cereale]
MKRHVSVLLSAAVAVACCLAISLPARAQQQTSTSYDTGLIPSPHIFEPSGEVTANVFLVSDAGGWGEPEESQAKALMEKGAVVIGIDFPTYIASLVKDPQDCIYMISDIESLAQQVQRSLGNSTYHRPMLAGIGAGGGLVLAMVAQSPPATIDEAIAVDPVASVPMTRELCTPAAKKPVDGGIVYALTEGALPTPVTVLLTSQADVVGKAHVKELEQTWTDIDLNDSDKTAQEALSAALSDHIDAAANSDQPLGLPLTILETRPTLDTMAIIYSGDGGWRDIDSEVGATLQAEGIPVVGLDSLRYFWTELKPQQVADDLDRIIRNYRREWNVKHVLLIGYSFGADVLPASYNLLPAEQKSRIAQMSLLALAREVDYEISVTGWLGVAGDGKGGDTVEDLKKINPKIVQCIYGTDDDDDPCPSLAANGVETVAIEGGHHFDEDYKGLADRIVAALKTRLSLKP